MTGDSWWQMDRGPFEEQSWASNPADGPGEEKAPKLDYEHEEKQPPPSRLEDMKGPRYSMSETQSILLSPAGPEMRQLPST